MPMIYMKKNLYDELVKRGLDPAKFVNQFVEKHLKEFKRDE